MTGTATSERVYDVVIVGGGAAGVGAAAALKHAGTEPSRCGQARNPDEPIAELLI